LNFPKYRWVIQRFGCVVTVFVGAGPDAALRVRAVVAAAGDRALSLVAPVNSGPQGAGHSPDDRVSAAEALQAASSEVAKADSITKSRASTQPGPGSRA
jgi:hypothetical protein